VKHTKEQKGLEALRDRRWGAEEAARILEEQDRSGLSVHGFAEKHQLSAPRLYYWRSRLKASTSEEVGLVPVVLTNTGKYCGAPLRVRVADVQLEILEPMAVDPAWLSTVVSMLRESRCS